ncbi:MAG: polymer-forming cytoskeletal protein [Pseudomonadota bacterium]
MAANTTGRIGADLAITGTLVNTGNSGPVIVQGYVDGEIHSTDLVVDSGGQVYGKIIAQNCDVHGTVQGTLEIANELRIEAGGSVAGDVTYKSLQLDRGGALEAQVRNIAPTLKGDLSMTVERGAAVPISLQDLAAFDPDNAPHELTFTVSNTRHGYVSLTAAPKTPVRRFSQADLAAGQVLFNHDAGTSDQAFFDVVVADSHGATAGAAKTVTIEVIN